MEQRDIQVIWQNRATKSLMSLHKFIAENNPENATRFINRMKDFGDSLGNMPEKFPVSRFKKFKKQSYHSAVFEKDFIFFYRINGNALYICHVLRTSRLK